MRVALAGCLLALATHPPLAATQVWKGVDKDGNVLYSDQPIPGGEVIEQSPVQTLQGPRPAAPASSAPPTEEVGYDVLEVLTPDQDATVRDNQGNVSVVVALTPNLMADRGHRAVILLDGAPASEPGTGTSFQLSNVERGTHTLQVQVLDAEGAALATSEPVTFHMHRVALGGTAR